LSSDYDLLSLVEFACNFFSGSYRGIRHIQGLPCRGQRTHANGKTTRRLKSTGANLPFNFKRAHAKALSIQRTITFSNRKKYKSAPKIAVKQNKKSKKAKKSKKSKKK